MLLLLVEHLLPLYIILQCNELNRGHPTFFLAPFSKYLVAFSLTETNLSSQVPHLRLVRNERTLFLLFWTRLMIDKKTLGGPGWVRYTVSSNFRAVIFPELSTGQGRILKIQKEGAEFPPFSPGDSPRMKTSLFRTYGIVSIFLMQSKAKINFSQHRIKQLFIKRFSKENRIVSG